MASSVGIFRPLRKPKSNTRSRRHALLGTGICHPLTFCEVGGSGTAQRNGGDIMTASPSRSVMCPEMTGRSMVWHLIYDGVIGVSWRRPFSSIGDNGVTAMKLWWQWRKRKEI